MYRKQTTRKTVSLDEPVWAQAQENMYLRGFNRNFSGYVADLIRRDLDTLTPQQRLILRDAYDKKPKKKG